jgi:hypothetical protein
VTNAQADMNDVSEADLVGGILIVVDACASLVLMGWFGRKGGG